jgi:hypothetical protein
MADMTASVRKQRKRKHSDEFRTRVLAEVDQPGVMLKTVAEKYNLAPSLIHLWRTQRRQLEIDSTPLAFVHCGQVADIADKDGLGQKPQRPTLSVLTPPAVVSDATVSPTVPQNESLSARTAAPTNEPQKDACSSDFPAIPRAAEPFDHVIGYPGERPGLIDIHMPQGVRILVDTFVNDKALARVFRALKAAA